MVVDSLTEKEKKSLVTRLRTWQHPWIELGKKYLYGLDPIPLDFEQAYRVLKVARDRNEPEASKYMHHLTCNTLTNRW